MHQEAGRVWTILSDEDEQLTRRLELEQLDSEGLNWFADGPGGAQVGALGDVLTAAAGPNVDAGWIDAVVAAIGRQLTYGEHGSLLLVIPGDGVWYHATATRNRSSIQRHGLDWSRMVPPGIAGSLAAETVGVSRAATSRELNGSRACAATRPLTSGQRRSTMSGWKALPPATEARTG